MSKTKDNKVKNESSASSNITGFSAPFGVSKKEKKDPNKPFTKKPPKMDFQECIARGLLDEDDIGEVVKKKGTQWVYFDDETGVQKGAFHDRDKAWELQRNFRRSQKAKKEKEKRTKKVHAPEVEKKPGIERQPGTIAIPAARTKKETIENLKKVLSESFMSYVFEQAPVSDDAVIWDKFLEKLSRDTIFSDNKLRRILESGIKSEVSLLDKSVAEIAKVLRVGTFDVKKGKIDKDPESNKVRVSFDVHMKENNKSLPFSVRLENGRPLIIIPDQSRDTLNNLANDESKLLRAELMHAQETVLDNMSEVLSVNEKRNKYLRTVEGKIDKILGQMNLLEIAMIKHLIRNKYKGSR